MSTDDAQIWNLRYREIATQLAGLSQRTQLAQRRLLRADGLTSLERELLLSDVAAIWTVVQTLGEQTRAWVGESGPPADTSSLT